MNQTEYVMLWVQGQSGAQDSIQQLLDILAKKLAETEREELSKIIEANALYLEGQCSICARLGVPLTEVVIEMPVGRFDRPSIWLASQLDWLSHARNRATNFGEKDEFEPRVYSAPAGG